MTKFVGAAGQFVLRRSFLVIFHDNGQKDRSATKQDSANGRSCHQSGVLSLAEITSTGILFFGARNSTGLPIILSSLLLATGQLGSQESNQGV
jgi:hypothetical protein